MSFNPCAPRVKICLSLRLSVCLLGLTYILQLMTATYHFLVKHQFNTLTRKGEGVVVKVDTCKPHFFMICCGLCPLLFFFFCNFNFQMKSEVLRNNYWVFDFLTLFYRLRYSCVMVTLQSMLVEDTIILITFSFISLWASCTCVIRQGQSIIV